MAERPSLHIAVAGQKSKASEYNDNFDMMMDYVEEVCEEATDYVDDQVDNKADKTLSNVTGLSDEIKALLSNDYATKDLSNTTSPIGSAPYISETYVNGTSGYIIYSNGLKIQWGQQHHYGGERNYTITFLTNFLTNDYIPSGSWSAVANVGDHELNYSFQKGGGAGMNIHVETNGYNSQECEIYWEVIGY